MVFHCHSIGSQLGLQRCFIVASLGLHCGFMADPLRLRCGFIADPLGLHLSSIGASLQLHWGLNCSHNWCFIVASQQVHYGFIIIPLGTIEFSLQLQLTLHCGSIGASLYHHSRSKGLHCGFKVDLLGLHCGYIADSLGIHCNCTGISLWLHWYKNKGFLRFKSFLHSESRTLWLYLCR